MTSWYRFDPAGDLILQLHVQPGARQTEVAGMHGGALKIKLAAPPVDGKANQLLEKFLAKQFSVQRKQVTLISGAHARHKLIRIQRPGADPESLLGK
ncbi:MAG: DUF167 domain-containing protein [Nitrosomonas sp.]|nr:DUF167 domain-containing protein [Nitrosomonas sp.]